MSESIFRPTSFLRLLLVPLAIGMLAACDDAPPAGVDDDEEEEVPTFLWPLSGSESQDADSVHSPYGPRWIGRYDFHAGIDIPAPVGTPVLAVAPGGVVQVRTWDSTSTGAGNAILVKHDYGHASSYLHLEDMAVNEGDRVEAGEVIGTVGSTGATYPHLHFGYMRDLPGNSVDERRSRNPLETLPHTRPSAVPAVRFGGGQDVSLTLPLQSMTVRSISLVGESVERVLDYYAIVARGFSDRKEQVQEDVLIQAARPENGAFDLDLELEAADFTIVRVVIVDIHGDTIADHQR